MNNLQPVFSWLQDNATWLQVVAAIFQAITGAIAIIVTLKAARTSVREAFQLNEKKERESLEEQINLLRFSLGLEIERNIEDLKLFYESFAYVRAQGTSTEEPARLTAQQRFIALNMPDLSYRFWHSQQLSSLLPRALNQEQIRDVNRIYADFDRLLKIVKTFGEEVFWRSNPSISPSKEAAFEGSGMPSSSAKELEKLLEEFEISLGDGLEKANPLRVAIEGSEEGRYISEGAQ